MDLKEASCDGWPQHHVGACGGEEVVRGGGGGGQRFRGIVKETLTSPAPPTWWSSCRRWCGWTGLVR